MNATRHPKSPRYEVAAMIMSVLLFTPGLLGQESASVSDPVDIADTSGDIASVHASVVGDFLQLSLTVHGDAAPTEEQTPEGMSNRYYYHWLVDTDSNPATGRTNSEYEGNPTNLENPIGADLVVQFGWRNGATDGVYVYDPADDETPIISNYPYHARGNTISATLPLEALGLVRGQSVSVSAFQEGASNGWEVDWIESASLTLGGAEVSTDRITDGSDMEDMSGDIISAHAAAIGDQLQLTMTVAGFAAPTLEQTPEGMKNRYYYHWLLDTDNNPATGRTNAEYEGSPTNLESPIGADLVVQFGWRDGHTDGVYVYDPADDETPIVSEYSYQIGGNTISATLPLSALGLVPGQTVSFSAFQEGASNGWQVDWIESKSLSLNGANIPAASVTDAAGDLEDSSGDLTTVGAKLLGNQLHLSMSVAGVAAPREDQTVEGTSNRYYYHWLLDTDNNPATGRSNSEYEGNPTNLENPIGSDLVVQFGWRNGAPDGIYVYDPADDETPIVSNYPYVASGNTITSVFDLESLGLTLGQTIAVSAFQEGASNGWKVDWVESASITLNPVGSTGLGVEAGFSGNGYGFTLTLTDEGDEVLDPDTIAVTLQGAAASISASKEAGMTTVQGRHPQLLAPESTHTLSVSATVGGNSRSQDFIVSVKPYEVLPQSSRGGLDSESKTGFLANITMISTWQPMELPTVHDNIASLAEQQLTGEILEAETGLPFYNEATSNFNEWEAAPASVEGVINWFELAETEDAVINFPNDEPFPVITELGPPMLEGMVIELKTYLELEAGYHQLGLFSEGGHKVTATHSPDGPLLSLYDNSENVESAPTYFGRSQIFDVVAERNGVYPVRILWFQSGSNQEKGMMLEFYSVKNKKLHLVNDLSNPDSIRAYQTASEAVNESPEITLSREGGNLILQWTGTLQMADSPQGPWASVDADTQSPLTWSPDGSPVKFARAIAE